MAGNDAVTPSRPSSSSTTAIWTSLWVSTPATTRRSSPYAMVDMPPFLLTWLGWHARPGGWTRQGADLVAQAPLRSPSPDRLCLGQGPAHSTDRSDQGHQSGLADHRVRPSERDSARFLDDHRNSHADHPCRSVVCPEDRTETIRVALSGIASDLALGEIAARLAPLRRCRARR